MWILKCQYDSLVYSTMLIGIIINLIRMTCMESSAGRWDSRQKPCFTISWSLFSFLFFPFLFFFWKKKEYFVGFDREGNLASCIIWLPISALWWSYIITIMRRLDFFFFKSFLPKFQFMCAFKYIVVSLFSPLKKKVI